MGAELISSWGEVLYKDDDENAIVERSASQFLSSARTINSKACLGRAKEISTQQSNYSGTVTTKK
jgi:hypothetical protein